LVVARRWCTLRHVARTTCKMKLCRYATGYHTHTCNRKEWSMHKLMSSWFTLSHISQLLTGVGRNVYIYRNAHIDTYWLST
jgi:hypothetical protein